MIEPAFRGINRFFVLSLKAGEIDSSRNSFDRYDMPLEKIKDFIALLDIKTIF